MSKNNQTTLSEISKKTREENAKDGLSRSIVEPQTEAQKDVLKKTKERKEDCIRTDKPKLEKPKEPIQKRKPSPKPRERTKMMVREQKGVEKEKKKKETTKKDGIARKTNVNEVKETRLVSLVVGGREKQLSKNEYQKLTPFLESPEKKGFIRRDKHGVVEIMRSSSLFDSLFLILRDAPMAMPPFNSNRIELLLEAEHYMLNEVVGKIKEAMKNRIDYMTGYENENNINFMLDGKHYVLRKRELVRSKCLLTAFFYSKDYRDVQGNICLDRGSFDNEIIVDYINGFGYSGPCDDIIAINRIKEDAETLSISGLVVCCNLLIRLIMNKKTELRQKEQGTSSSGSNA